MFGAHHLRAHGSRVLGGHASCGRRAFTAAHVVMLAPLLLTTSSSSISTTIAASAHINTMCRECIRLSSGVVLTSPGLVLPPTSDPSSPAPTMCCGRTHECSGLVVCSFVFASRAKCCRGRFGRSYAGQQPAAPGILSRAGRHRTASRELDSQAWFPHAHRLGGPFRGTRVLRGPRRVWAGIEEAV